MELFCRNSFSDICVIYLKNSAEFSPQKYWQAATYEDPALILQRFVVENGVRILNVAGTRGSEEPDVWRFAYETLEAAFFWEQAHPGLLGGPDDC